MTAHNLPLGHRQIQGFRVWGLGFRAWGLGFRAWGLGLRVEGLGFSGFGFRV